MSLHLAIAGIGSRFLAIAVDTLVQILAMLVTILVLGFLGYSGSLAAMGEYTNWILAAYGVFVFMLFYGYFAIFEILWSGQTPGKRYVGIRVIKDSGRPLTAGETIGRNLMRIIDQLPFFYAVGILVALLNSQHKRLGDLLVGSILVRESSLAELKPLWHAPVNASAGVQLNTSALTAADLVLIDAFLARRHSLDWNIRQARAAQIVERLRVRLPPDLDSTGPAESILEALSYHKRSTGHLER
jgi:uncharacterized RDD family membrane protein YckC